MAAHRLRCAFGFGCACTELNSCVAVTLFCALVNNLKRVELKNGHRDLLTVFHEQAGHAHFLCNYTGAHVILSLNRNLNVNASSEVELHERVHCLWCWINDVEKTLVCADLKLVA